ncbi:MAG: hypothetical protein Pg6C_00720 [Treponemataceae bacterium]|nr:MAG: hypothetical protein Pg6C_00720 [Treponemataceae bacterium]
MRQKTIRNLPVHFRDACFLAEVPRKCLNTAVLFALAAVTVFSEAPDEVKQFITGSIADKTRVISMLDMDENLPERVRRLPGDAIEFVLSCRGDMGDSPELENLFLAALGKMRGNTAQDTELLTAALAQTASPKIAGAVISRFYDLAKADPSQMKQAVPGINAFLRDSFPSLGANADVIRSAVRTLELCGDSSSFDILLDYAAQMRDAQTAAAAQSALAGIGGAVEQNFLRAISERPAPEKLQIFRIIRNQQLFSEEFKAKCAETALSQAITIARDSGPLTRMNAVSGDVIAMQTEALTDIVRYEWTQSSQLVLSLFPVAQKEYEAGILSEDRFIQAIQANAALGVSGAGRVLSNFLAVLNSITEKSSSDEKPVSAGVLLALINTLGALGDKTAFDNLLYVTYLDYDAAVIKSAREALAKLKW